MAFPTIDHYLLDATAQRKLPAPHAAGSLSVISSSISMTASALGLNAVSRVLWVPAGFTLWGVAVNLPDLDSGGSPALVWDLGHSDDQDGIIAGSSVGQAAGQLNTDDMAVAGMGYTFTADTDILWTTTTAAATAAAGTVKLALFGEPA